MSEVLGSRSRGFYSKKFALLFEEFARSYFARLGSLGCLGGVTGTTVT